MEQTTNVTNSQVKATSSFRYAIGMLGTSIPINMFKTYAFLFYVVNLGLSTKLFALIIGIYTVLDAIDNPVYGFLSDRTRTRWGRRRPWLVIGTPLLTLAFILFYSPPVFGSEKMMFVYVLLTYCLTGTLDSLINANYGALFPELFRDDAKRAKTNALRQIFQLVAMIISIALTPLVAEKLGYQTTAIVYGSFALVIILYCTFGCRENPEAMKTEKPKILSSLRSLVTNKKFWVYGATNAFYTAALVLVLQAVPVFAKYSLKIDSGKTTLLQGAVISVAIASMFLWAWLIKRKKLIPTWRTALCLLCVAFIPLYFVKTLLTSIIACSLIGFSVAGVLATMDLIAARIMDEDAIKYGVRREGIYSSTMGFMNKLSGFFVSIAFLLVNSLYGFESGKVPGPDPDGAARFLLVIFPFAAMIISSACSFLMKFKDTPKKSKDDLAA